MAELVYYLFDDQHIFTESTVIDPYAALPRMGTPVPPPVALPPQVAQWQGIEWTLLDERPPYVEPPAPTPNPVPAPPPMNKIDFLRLFTPAEIMGIRAAATTNELVGYYQYMLDAATVVMLNDPDIVAGVPMLEAGGLLEPGRASQILAGQPPS